MAVRTANAVRGPDLRDGLSRATSPHALPGAGELSLRKVVAPFLLALLFATAPSHADGPSSGATIRLRAPSAPTPDSSTGDPVRIGIEGRRGFDYEAFRGRLETLWFQRKGFLAAGRETDAANQSQLIRAFCAEERVRRLDDLAAALLFEARAYQEEGNHARAAESLDFAEFFAPGSAQVHRARAGLFWASGAGIGETAAESVASFRAALLEQWRDLTLANHVVLVILAALLACALLFALLLLARHHAEFRHEVEERVKGTAAERWGGVLGWGSLLFPVLLWIGAGWAALFWFAALFRYLRRAERAAVAVFLLVLMLLPPAFRAAVAFRAMTDDPMVRTTMASADGAYEPERVVKLQNLVASHPDDPTYHFLLARLYANGRFFEEAFAEYKRVLALDPAAYEAHVNVGNILYHLGQYGEAVVQYRRAMESRPGDVLAFYDAYVTHSEWFRFKEAQEYLEKGTSLNPEGMALLLQEAGRPGGRMTVVDATIDLSHVWLAAMEGKPLRGIAQRAPGGGAFGVHLRSLWNPWSVLCFLTLVLCALMIPRRRGFTPARLCLRCGRPYCSLCKSEREKGKEYCNHCVHLFVLRDGLAAETKTRKLYEVDRYGQWTRRTQLWASFLLPGAGQVLSGRAFRGCAVLLVWLVALFAFAPGILSPLGAVSGFDLELGRLHPTVTPAWSTVDAVAILGSLIAAAAWAGTNLRIPRRREA